MELEVPTEDTELQLLQDTSDSTSVIGMQDMEVDVFVSPSQANNECTPSDDAASLADEGDMDSSEEDG